MIQSLFFSAFPKQVCPILMALSTNAMLLLDQKTLQIKYRVPAAEIYRLSLSPYHDNIAVFHLKDVCIASAEHRMNFIKSNDFSFQIYFFCCSMNMRK